jgi:PAS domain-containing protein
MDYAHNVTTTADVLARGRQVLLGRAQQLVGRMTDPDVDHAESLQASAALLTTSLEELRVAEEELREQNDRLRKLHAAEHEKVYHYKELFRQLPFPLLITDRRATILETNAIAAKLLKRDARHLERKPLCALLDPSERDDFRKKISRIDDVEGPIRWSLVLLRKGDLPVVAQATVSVVEGLGSGRGGLLSWIFTETSSKTAASSVVEITPAANGSHPAA